MTDRDGYYLVSGSCIILGAIILLFIIKPTTQKLHGKLFHIKSLSDTLTYFEALPSNAWRVKLD